MVLLSLFLAFGSSWEQRDEADGEARFGWWLGRPGLDGDWGVPVLTAAIVSLVFLSLASTSCEKEPFPLPDPFIILG